MTAKELSKWMKGNTKGKRKEVYSICFGSSRSKGIISSDPVDSKISRA